jgi:glycosyltransferase involved in cell wall biosynthesis
MTPKVSIIIRAYNFEKLVARAIESAVSQDFPRDEFEIVVVNDGSRDETLDVIRSYADKNENIRVVDQENQGAIVAGNNGFSASRGEYIVMLDDDDYFVPNLVRDLSQILDVDKSINFAYSDYYEESDGNKKLVQPANVFETIAGGVMFRRFSVGDKLWTDGLFFPEYDIFLRHPKWKGRYHPVALYTYSRRKESLAGDDLKVKNGIEQLKKLYPDKLDLISKIRGY